MPLAWVWILSREDLLLVIFVAPALVLVTWALTMAGMVSGWRFDRHHAPGPGRVAAWSSLTLLVMVLLAANYLLFGAASPNFGWLLLALAGAGHALCVRQMLLGPTRQAFRAVLHLPLAIVLFFEGAFLLMASSRVRVLGTDSEVAAVLAVVSLGLAVGLLVLRLKNQQVPGLQVLIAAYAVAFLLALLASLYMNLAILWPAHAAMLVLLATNAAKLALTSKGLGPGPTPADPPLQPL